MDICKVKNYRVFADQLSKRTGCDIIVRLMGKDHVHYELDKMGISLGVLCIDNGEASFAPFETLNSAKNDQFINVQYTPMLDDFVHVLHVFRDMFVSDEPMIETKENDND